MEAQLAGHAGPAHVALTRAAAGPLRDDISTDEITPLVAMTVWDQRLGRVPYTGLKLEGRCPVARDAVRAGGFNITVAGARYGKGSSREHSPMAEWHAGIRLVVASSFERIYRQNADNIGIFTSTDLSVVDRLLAGRPVALEELVASRDRLTQAVLRAGGLLNFGQQHLRVVSLAAATRPPRPAGAESGTSLADSEAKTPRAVPGSRETAADHAPQTLVQKILQRHLLHTEQAPATLQAGQGVFVKADWRFIHEYYTGMAAHLLDTRLGAGRPLYDSASILCFEDHVTLAERSLPHVQGGLLPQLHLMLQAHRHFAQQHGLVNHAALDSQQALAGGSPGITHPLMTEQVALPGQLVVGTDSHTPHIGALGCLAFGIGSTDMANAFATGAVRLVVPQSLRVELIGPLASGITAKDVALQLLALPAIRAGAGLARVFEFCGSAVQAMSIDERATLTNMTAELGGFSGIVAPDQHTVDFLRDRRGLSWALQPWMCSDEGAAYESQITLDCRRVRPMVAAPGDPGNGIALPELAQRPKIDIAYGGSCTGGKREDFDHYHAVLLWGLQQGLRVAPGVQLVLQFGTLAVRDYCIERGYLATFEAIGADMLMPSCGSCGNCGPGSSSHAGQVTVSAINRNFPGRGGPGAVWLASPLTVAASALAGALQSFDELKRLNR